jgi:putative ABC transport system permease protein
MLKNYVTVAWRNLIRSRGYSLINIAGLATSMAVALLIGLWVFDELNFNKNFKNYDRIGQLYHHISFGDEPMTIADIPIPIGEKFKSSYPDFETVAIATWQKKHVLKNQDKTLSEEGLFVEPEFLKIFSVRMIEGSDTPLRDIHSIVLSQTLAAKIVGDNAVGKMIQFDNLETLMVTGVFEDFPASSTFANIHLLVSMADYYSISESHRKQMNNWEDYNFQCFVLMKEDASFTTAESKIKKVLFDNASNDGKALKPEGVLLPMDRWHLHAQFEDGIHTGGKIRFVWMFGTVGVFVLILACINFMNLSTAQSERRSKEVGVRKVMGSARMQLVLQFLSESLMLVTIGYVLALLLAALALPSFNSLAEKKMTVPWLDPYFIFTSIGFVLFTSLLAGSYPALFLSAFQPVRVLKGALKTGRFAALPRKVMVVFQFATSIVLMTCTTIVFLQIQHAKDRPVGFDRDGIFHVAMRTENLAKANYNTLRNELLNTGVVGNMAISDFPVTGSMAGDASITWDGKDPALKPLVALNSCSHDFPSTNGFVFIDGRDFDRERSSDTLAVIINEMAANLIGRDNIIGKKITFGYGKERTIIGVIKDQVRWTPFSKQSPHIYFINYDAARYLTIRMNPAAATNTVLQKVEATLKKFDAGAPFEYEFLDDDYARNFQDEERVGKLSSIFSLLAIFISCIGIFGLAAFSTSQRTKEIGIRKVLGASVFSLWRMLSNDFIKLVIVAIVVSSPIAYYLVLQWLEQYDYRIGIPWLVFVVTGITAIAITLFTVSYQTVLAALKNPVKSLKIE